MKFHRILILTFFAYILISCGGAEERKSVYMEKAKASIEAGDLEKARIELKNVLQIDPKDGEAYYQLGNVYEQQKEYRKAYGNYLKAEELSPELLVNHAKLGRFYLLLMNDAEKAQEKVDLILSKEPGNADGLLLKAAMFLKEKNKEKAINIAKDVLLKEPGNTDSIMFLATLYFSDKNYSQALKTLDSGLKDNQSNKRLNKLLALVLVNNNEYERAEKIYRQLLDKDPDIAHNYNTLAALYHKLEKKDKAEDVLRESIKYMPEDTERYLTLVKYLKSTQGNEQAIAELKNIIKNDSRESGFRNALGELLWLNKQKDEAINVYNQTILDFPEEGAGVDARIALAAIRISEKDFLNAATIIDEAVNVSPNDPKVNFLRAKLALRNKQFEKAIISLRIVTKETPEEIDAYFLLVRAYQLEGNKEQIESVLNNAYENNKTNPEGLLKLAQYYLATDVIKAEKIIDDYNSLKVDDHKGMSIKAVILNKRKLYDGAYDIAKRLIDLHPTQPDGYLQSIAYLGQQDKKSEAISVLEKGYINSKNNRKILLLLTSLQVSNKQFEIVEKRINAEIQQAPEDVALKVIKAKVAMAKGDSNNAIGILEAMTVNKTKIEEPYLLLSQLYLTNKNKIKEKKVLIAGMENVTTSLKIPLKLAVVYERNKEYNAAINVYRKLNELKPDNVLIVNNLVSMLSDHGNGKEDIKHAAELSKQLEGTKQPVFLDTLGWLHYMNKNYIDAIKYLSQVVEKDPNTGVYNYHLGMAYKMSGNKTKAKLYLENSLKGEKPFNQKAVVKSALKDL